MLIKINPLELIQISLISKLCKAQMLPNLYFLYRQLCIIKLAHSFTYILY